MNMLEVKGGKVALKDGVEIFKAAANTNNQFGAQLKDIRLEIQTLMLYLRLVQANYLHRLMIKIW